MLTVEQEYYIRFILLILHAGTDLLREITKKALGKKNETLLQFLSSAKCAILNDKKLTKIQKDILYPPSPQGPSFEDFDITLMSHLLNNYLIQYIDMNEVNAVNDIQKIRNNDYAHVKDATMDAQTFWKQWNKLATIIKYVNTGMTPDVQKRHKDMIKHIEKDPLDITVALEEIKKLDQSRDFFETIQQSLESIQKDQQEIIKSQLDLKKGQEVIYERQKDISKGQSSIIKGQEQLSVKVDEGQHNIEKGLEQLSVKVDTVETTVYNIEKEISKIREQIENQDRNPKTVHTIKADITLGADKPGTIEKAESALVEATNNSIAKKEPTDFSNLNLHDKIASIIADLGPAVRLEGALLGSVVFVFQCMSLEAILELVDYVYGTGFQTRLNHIATALEDVMGTKFWIKSVCINRQSLQDVITKMDLAIQQSSTEEDKSKLEASGVKTEEVITPKTQDEAKPITETKQSETIWPTNVLSLIEKKEINVGSKSGETEGYITCIAVLSPDRILVADHNNCKLKVVNIQTRTVVDGMNLPEQPCGIAVLAADKVAITLPFARIILILSIKEKMSMVHAISVKGSPWGIAYNENELYVVCEADSYWVQVMTLQGEVLRQHPLNIRQHKDRFFGYIAVSKDHLSLYISDWQGHTVTKYTLQGEKIAEYQHEDLKWPQGLTILDNGSLLACCNGTGNIHHISADLKQGYTLTNVPQSQSICYQPDNHQVYVGCLYSKDIKVFVLKEQPIDSSQQPETTSSTRKA